MIDYSERIYTLPFMVLRGMCVFPNTSVSIDVVRRKSYEALEQAVQDDGMVFMVTQVDQTMEAIREDNLYGMGTIAHISRVSRMPGNMARVYVDGIARARIKEVETEGSYVKGQVVRVESVLNTDELHIEAACRLVNEEVIKYSTLNTRFFANTIQDFSDERALSADLDRIAGVVDLNLDDKQSLLEKFDIFDRARELARLVNRLNAVLEIKKDIALKVKKNIDAEQKKYMLREQLKAITQELGDEGAVAEIEEYRKKMASLSLPDYAVEKLEKEFDRLKRMPAGAQEASVSKDYIEAVLALPWGVYSEENTSLEKAQKVLDIDHYGLEKVKERIVEFLAVKINGSDINGSILCLVGPPGVGKTSVARSVAEALSKKYVRMSLGGMHDEAEIRGHRRTYIGAMPGRIIDAIKQAGTSNPLILLDEIDKLSKDYKGDPASALLEVLDGEQNSTFRDNYLDMPFDLSKVLFVCTANSLDTIPGPLRDRMDIIELSSYTTEERFAIAKKYLYPKQLKKHNLKKTDLKIKDSALRTIVEKYSAEAGVRQTERYIEKLCRIAVKESLMGNGELAIDNKNIDTYLGKPLRRGETLNKYDEVGVCRGLAWTSIGGTTLEIEVNTYKGKGEVKITGNVGKVMEESSVAALSYIKANAERLNIDMDFEKTDIHIHIPEGATPKDGPSAGVTMATAMISAMTGNAVRRDIAMTGEVNIRGRVMPIGGLKEKVLAARKIGVKKVILPVDNAPDLDEIPDYCKKGMDFVLADDMSQVLKNALVEEVRV